MKRHAAGRGFTLVDLLVVMAMLGILVALLLPATQAARDVARRVECNDNLKNLALALQNYHDVYKTFPRGAMHAGPHVKDGTSLLGPSWWCGILPFIEERSMYDKINAVRPQVAFNEATLDAAIGGSRNPIKRLVGRYMRCPSSPLPVTEMQGGPICLPTYVGIAGGCDIDPNTTFDYSSTDLPAGTMVAPVSTRKYFNRQKALIGTGLLTASGLLPAGEQLGMQNCTDGTSNTMIVGEQSDWLQSVNRAEATKYHGDPGWDTSPNTTAGAPGGTTGGGWVSGTIACGPVPRLPGEPPSTDAKYPDCYNITTVRYKPNLKKVLPGAPGCSENHGINNPLQSAHPGGLLVGMCDGSVQFIGSTVDFAVLLRLAIRDDGQNVIIP